jgi:hypothetical protein
VLTSRLSGPLRTSYGGTAGTPGHVTQCSPNRHRSRPTHIPGSGARASDRPCAVRSGPARDGQSFLVFRASTPVREQRLCRPFELEFSRESGLRTSGVWSGPDDCEPGLEHREFNAHFARRGPVNARDPLGASFDFRSYNVIAREPLRTAQYHRVADNWAKGSAANPLRRLVRPAGLHVRVTRLGGSKASPARGG